MIIMKRTLDREIQHLKTCISRSCKLHKGDITLGVGAGAVDSWGKWKNFRNCSGLWPSKGPYMNSLTLYICSITISWWWGEGQLGKSRLQMFLREVIVKKKNQLRNVALSKLYYVCKKIKTERAGPVSSQPLEKETWLSWTHSSPNSQPDVSKHSRIFQSYRRHIFSWFPLPP